MSNENNNDIEAAEFEGKPTITIAEKDSEPESAIADRPTITIAEKDGGS